jgi:hypothetical protein
MGPAALLAPLWLAYDIFCRARHRMHRFRRLVCADGTRTVGDYRLATPNSENKHGQPNTRGQR